MYLGKILLYKDSRLLYNNSKSYCTILAEALAFAVSTTPTLFFLLLNVRIKPFIYAKALYITNPASNIESVGKEHKGVGTEKGQDSE
jgi:hypothetical protein